MCWEAFCDGHKNCSKSGVFVYRDDSICGHVPGAQKILYRMWNYGIGWLDDILARFCILFCCGSIIYWNSVYCAGGKNVDGTA